MNNVLDLTNLDTKRVFVVGELRGDHNALMRLLYQQKFTWKDALITCGNFFDLEHQQTMELVKFLRNTMNSYSVKGDNEVKFLKNIEDRESEKCKEIENKMGVNFNENIIDYISNLPLVIKIGDFYIMHAGVDPHKALEDQDPEVFYSIGEYDKDSRFYQYPNPEKSSWYNTPFLVNGIHIKICFGKIYLEDAMVPSGYNLGRGIEVNAPLRCLVIDKAQWITSLITSA